MLPVELTFFTANILALPQAAVVLANGVALLRDAFTAAHFEVGADIPAEVKGLTFYLGGFEAMDPATGSAFRVMAELRHSTTRAPEAGGIAYNWAVTAPLDVMRKQAAGQRGLREYEVRSHRLSPIALAELDADGVLERFDRVLSGPAFQATAKQANQFVASLVADMAP